MKNISCITTTIFLVITVLVFLHLLQLQHSSVHAQSCGITTLVGDDDTLSGTGDLPANVWKSLQFTARTSGTVSCFKVFLKDLPNPPSHLHNLGYALYTNNPSAHGGCGHPGTLIAYGIQPNYDWSVIGTNQWHEFPLIQTAEVIQGTVYWVAFCSDGGFDGWHFGRASELHDPGHAERKRGCNTHSWNNIPDGTEWNMIYPNMDSPCADNGNYSWFFSNSSYSPTSSTTTSPTVTTSANTTTTTSTNALSTTSTSPVPTTSTYPFTTTSLGLTTTSLVENDMILNFSVNSKFGFTPLTVEFTNLSTGPIAYCQWDFGDGVTSNAPNPIHTYTNVGIFTVKLFAHGINGTIETTSKPNLIVTLLGCPIASIIDNHKNINTLRIFRNHMLKNIFGFILVSLYYQNSNEIFKILINNPGLNDKLNTFISESIDIPEAIINENIATVGETTVQEAIHLLEQLKTLGSRQLEEDFNIAINALNNNEILSELGISLQ